MRFRIRRSPEDRSGMQHLITRHFLPEPRLGVGLWLARRRLATAAIDLSDGLSQDLHRLCAASGVGAVIRQADLPISLAAARWAADPVACALHGGEDYELLFTAPPSSQERLAQFAPAVPLRRIGEIAPARRGVKVEVEGRLSRLEPGGFDHLAVRGGSLDGAR
jgi:thiamine-monophosphate kinase